MRAGARKESVDTRGRTARNDGLHSIDGAGSGDGGITETQGISLGTPITFGGGEGGVDEKAWFAPIESSASPDILSFGECKDGVCPVPWATKSETNPVFTFEGGPILFGDDVNHPIHYTDGSIECIEAIEAQLTAEEFRGYLKGNIAKYIWREKHKGGTKSLKKGQWYLDRLVQTDEIQNG
jgi:hypothetical protein